MKRVVYLSFYMIVALALLCCGMLSAAVPQPSVKLLLISVSADTTILVPGESAPSALNVPLYAKFESELSSDDETEYQLFPQWTISRTYTDGETQVTEEYLKRQESITEYEFTDHGKFQVNFAWSYREKGQIGTIPGDEVQPMTFTVDDSQMRLFNAFSPNGDGINDVYKIYVRSIVSMKIVIFNRWGQTIKSLQGTLDNILPAHAEPDGDGGYLFEIWDGRFNGETVNDGVYFINVQAVGAGGKRYEEKADINVLTGLGTGL